MRQIVFTALAVVPVLASFVFAASSIDPIHKFAWAENIGWTNWRDANSGDDGVAVSDTYLGGFVWGENVGWINAGDASPGDGVHYGNTDGSDAGVNIDPATGDLFGLAWGENIGWINFDTRTALGPYDQQARFDANDCRFYGYAWGENVGWINLDHGTHYVGVLAGPTPLAWRSVREHWIPWIGPVPLPIVLDAAATGTAVTCEPRREGVQRIEVDFDVNVSGLITGTVVAKDLTHGGTIPATGQYTINAGTTLVVEFQSTNPSPPPAILGLADQTCYRIDLGANIANPCADMDCEFRVLAGDINGSAPPYGDGKTDLTDMAKANAVSGMPLTEETCLFDVNVDGKIDLTDMALIKSLSLSGHAATCP